MKTELVLAYDKKAEIKELFTEYIDMLLENDASFKEYLKLQNYDDEIDHFEKKYGLPYGRLYVLYVDSKLAGCIALRRIDDENCEIKRLYIREEFRGLGLGKTLVEKIVNDAKEIGYRHVLLDTLPFLKIAINLYLSYGFYEIESYNDSPMDTSIFMCLDL